MRAVALVWLAILTLLPHALGEGPGSAPTFDRDVAPILFEKCVSCHRPGGVAGFALGTFRDAKKRAKLIASVTANRYMPPWLPVEGYGHFEGERRLTDAQIATLGDWVKGGAPEGKKGDLPPPPVFPSEWQLGTPDLVVTLPKAYRLPAAGRDLYRNFVIPKVLLEDRYVRAVEMRPGHTSAIHHAFVRVDESGSARQLEAKEETPGFPGMDGGRGTKNPGGFLSWQPGRGASEVPSGMSWLLRKNSDLVLQLHLRSTGKPEEVQPSVALYFTTQAPTRPNMIMLLRSAEIDIPPGNAEYAIESSYKLPVDASIVGILPHMHYLGKEVHSWAELPDGSTQELLLIKNWDFNWQRDYRYAEPVRLPKGTTMRMREVYDNSAANARNPNQPPQRVQYGLQSSDEMGELWLWVETETPADLQALRRDYFGTWGRRDNLSVNEALLRRDPKNAYARMELGANQAVAGHATEAVANLLRAVADDPKLQRAHYILGTLWSKLGHLPEAEASLETAVELDPKDEGAQCNLGLVLLQQGKRDRALTELLKALALDPNDTLARKGIQQAKQPVGAR